MTDSQLYTLNWTAVKKSSKNWLKLTILLSFDFSLSIIEIEKISNSIKGAMNRKISLDLSFE